MATTNPFTGGDLEHGQRSQPTTTLEQQEQTFRDQDAALDEISRGLLNVRRMGEEIGTEANLHTSLLGEIERDVDRNLNSMQRVTEQSRQVRQQTSTCKLWLLILGLFVVLLLLISFKV